MSMKSILTLTSAMALFAASSFAATSNVTAISKMNPYIGTAPATGYISATVTSTTTPRVALPSAVKTVNAIVCSVKDSTNNLVPRSVFVSGTDVYIATATGMTSGTLAVGDKLNCIVSFER